MRSVVIALASACSFSPPGSMPDDEASGDAAPLDGAADTSPGDTDLVIEAEAFTTATMPGSIAWTQATDLPGHSGNGFMRCGQQTGGTCESGGSVDNCAALIFDLPITLPGTYFVHLRAQANASGSEDTAFYGIDDQRAPDVPAFPRTSTWSWVTGETSYPLAAGPHRLTIWQRESGAKLDVVAVTTRSTYP